jgi:hypothetical protein
VRENIIAAMQNAGLTQLNQEQPGIYVRSEEMDKRHPIDWRSEPAELLTQVRAQIQLGVEQK